MSKSPRTHMQTTGRSDSSKPLRDQLKAHYAQPPDVLNTLKFTQYIDFAKKLFEQANSTYIPGDPESLNHAYIYFSKFLGFATNSLPKHNGYKLKSNEGNVFWLRRASNSAYETLLNIVLEMDREEDRKLEEQLHHTLIDEFDNDEFDDRGSNAVIEATVIEHVDSPYSSGKSPADPFVGDPFNVGPTQTPQRNLVTVFSTLKGSENENTDSVEREDHASEYERRLSEYAEYYELPKQEQSESDYDRFAGISVTDLEILHRLPKDISKFYIPQPSRSTMTLRFNENVYTLSRDDFHVSMMPFLQNLPPELQLARSAVETNRCFFIHLGVSMQIHPFALQLAFRHLAKIGMDSCDKNDPAQDILSTLGSHAGFVDANCLAYIWPAEFNPSRICFISGTQPNLIFLVFYAKNVADPETLREVLIHCDGSHFTLLRPITKSSSFSVLPGMLRDARAAGNIVLMNEVDPTTAPEAHIHRRQPSIKDIIRSVRGVDAS